MGTVVNESDDEYSVIGDKGDIGFIDLKDCESICRYNPSEESDVVVISVPFPLVEGKPQSTLVGETCADSITIKNITNESLDLWSVEIYDSKPLESFTLSIMKPPTTTSDEQYVQEFLESFRLEDRILRAGQTLIVWLSCKPKVIGIQQSAVHFKVGDETIERVVFLIAEDKISRSLTSNRPFHKVRKKRNLVFDGYSSEAFVVGSRPSKPLNCGSRKRLPLYPIPEDIRELIQQKQIPDAILSGLTKANYASYFMTLAFMEEIKMEEDMRDYDMEFVTMRSKGLRFLSLEVPGLAERRPSLVRGDYIFAKLPSGDPIKTIAYQGYINRVEAEEVFLKFREDFHLNHRPTNSYNVQFTFNRISRRRLYQAIEAAGSLGNEVLFPSDCQKARFIRSNTVVPITNMLNEEQICAIEMILGCKGGCPYVIHGPPGTGKTMTLVEAVLQLYTCRKNSRILVCAPSNSSADHILEKLLSHKVVEVCGSEILRLNAVTRPFEDVNPEYIGYCCVDDSVFMCPHLSDLKRYRIIVSTYTSAYLLYAEGMTRGHFSHIFLDEAGQVSEPETMVPLSHFCQRNTVVVLAGDPMQLGPVVFSKDAESCGLGKPYLERLFECQFYRDGNKNYVKKLLRNYRCHPTILHLPSELFYCGQLIPCKENDESSSNWLDLLPKPEFPILFVGIQGIDEREGSNPSWFNRIEASKVVEIITDLMADKGLSEEDVGVITPYRQQVLKIRKALESLDLPNIKVGTVEQFQGQERKVIIVSTVRSTIQHNEFDKIHYLGFLSNPRRFNVAITRARSLLILVGNPHIISKDEYWNKLLWYCSDNESYTGCFLPVREELKQEGTATEFHIDNEGEKNFQPYGYNEWVDDDKGQISQSYGDVEWGDHSVHAENCPNPYGDVVRGDDTVHAEGLPKPVTDESEWSDGWK